MTRQVLVATDFSTAAGNAVERAAALARQHGSTLTLLNVVAPDELAELARILRGSDDTARARGEAAAGTLLDGLAAALARSHGIGTRTQVRSGPVAARIVEAAAALPADLLVMGARGERALRDFLLGNSAERVLRKSTHSLLVVRQPPAGPYARVLVPVDFSPHAAHALALAGTLAPGATLTALHVFEAPLESKLAYAGVAAADIEAYRRQGCIEAEQALAALVASLPPGLRERVVPEVVSGYAPGLILQRAADLDCDLVALGKHGRSAVEEWVLGSVTQHVLANARCDVLAADRRAAATG